MDEDVRELAAWTLLNAEEVWKSVAFRGGSEFLNYYYLFIIIIMIKLFNDYLINDYLMIT